jgi:hypothetical protein
MFRGFIFFFILLAAPFAHAETPQEFKQKSPIQIVPWDGRSVDKINFAPGVVYRPPVVDGSTPTYTHSAEKTAEETSSPLQKRRELE